MIIVRFHINNEHAGTFHLREDDPLNSELTEEQLDKIPWSFFVEPKWKLEEKLQENGLCKGDVVEFEFDDQWELNSIRTPGGVVLWNRE